MLNMEKIAITVIIIFIQTGCWNSRWSDEERKEFKTKCLNTNNFNIHPIEFRGFDNNEFDSILVKEYNNAVWVDSFKIYVSPSHPAEKIRQSNIHRVMNIHYKYKFMIPGQKPIELANMKMVMWPQFTQRSEGYGCIMGDYTIDGVRFENGNPIFIKQTNIIDK